MTVPDFTCKTIFDLVCFSCQHRIATSVHQAFTFISVIPFHQLGMGMIMVLFCNFIYIVLNACNANIEFIFFSSEDLLCGSDGVTYYGECELGKAKCEAQKDVYIVKIGQCEGEI